MLRYLSIIATPFEKLLGCRLDLFVDSSVVAMILMFAHIAVAQA